MLTAVPETVLELFNNSYRPFNSEKAAIVYLIDIDYQQVDLLALQTTSITMK